MDCPTLGAAQDECWWVLEFSEPCCWFRCHYQGWWWSFVAARIGSSENISSPLLLEVMALRVGLLWAIDRGYQFLIIETDSLHIVEALRDPTLNLSPIEQVVEDYKALLNTITEVNITHICRNANAAAHRLTKVGLYPMQSCEWISSPPNIITNILEDCV